MDLYEKRCGYRFDLENPKTFTEKIIWYKVYYDNPVLTGIVDKYRFKKYIRKKLGKGYTLPMYGAWKSVRALRRAWRKLPKEFMLKSNLQSDGRYIKHIEDKDAVDLEALLKEVGGWLVVRHTLIHSYCRAYYGATPRIIAEEYAENVAGQLYDYKVFCFRGVPHCIYVASNHFSDDFYPITFYDMQWNRMDVRYGEHRTEEVPPPPHLQQMIELAAKLSVDFPFVRVDFFDTPEKLYLAEMTFYPGGGQVLYNPPSFNQDMGDLFVLPGKE